MTIGDRIKQLRKELKLTQTEFGEKIGVARITVACYENNSHKVSDYIIKNICRTFNVDYYWLTEGKFEMFLVQPNGTIDKLMSEYNIDSSQLPLIKAYLKSTPQAKDELLRFISNVNNERSSNE